MRSQHFALRRPSEISSHSNHEAVGTLSSSRKRDSPSTSCKACGSGQMSDWQHSSSWGQLNYVPILNRHDAEEQCEDSCRLSSNPSHEACNATTSSAFNASCALLVPCCGVVASQYKDNEPPLVASQANIRGHLVARPAAVAAHELGAKLHNIEHNSAATAAVGDLHQQQSRSGDNELVLDATAFAALQDKVAAAQLEAMFMPSAGRASSLHAAAADSGQSLDSLALAQLEVPYKQVSGAGLCYVGRY